MPERKERFFWVYSENPAAEIVDTLDKTVGSFAAAWRDSSVEHYACVSDPAPTNRMWLLVVPPPVHDFGKALKDHLAVTRHQFTLPEKRLKYRSSLPTPLLRLPLGNTAMRTDIGLHSVNNAFNGSLTTFTYWQQAGKQFPKHLQAHEVTRLSEDVAGEWGRLSCGCHAGRACKACGGLGCFQCFELACSACDGTGWKDFAVWKQKGFRVAYSQGYPIALWE